MDVYSLRVRRTVAGRHFPFDRIYLVRDEHRSVLKSLFRYALVMPVEGHLLKMLREVKIDTFAEHSFHRDDELSKKEAPAKGEWEALLDGDSWVMAVPILTKWMQKNLPRYLTAASWYHTRVYRGPGRRRRQMTTPKVQTNENPFPKLTYLQTPEKNIRPVCVACPRMMLQQAGHCKLGDAVCYQSLALGINNYFKEGLDAPEPSKNIFEEDVEEVIRANVQDDRAGASRDPAPSSDPF